jgi:hypothetical protein
MGNREPGRDMSSTLCGARGCASTALRSAREPSVSCALPPHSCLKRGVSSRPKRSVGSGVGRWVCLDANTPLHPQPPRNDTNNPLANGCSALPAKQATRLRNDRPPRSGLGGNGVLGLRRWRREGGLHEVTAAYCRICSRKRAAMSRRATSSRLDLSVQRSGEPDAVAPAPSLLGRRSPAAAAPVPLQPFTTSTPRTACVALDAGTLYSQEER